MEEWILSCDSSFYWVN